MNAATLTATPSADIGATISADNTFPGAAASAFQAGFAPTVSSAEMASHRGYLVRFARRRLRDPLLAEDAVHDVFEAVLSGRAVFAGRAALRSWLVAVLKHKIVDSVRRNAGTDSLDEAFGDDDGDGAAPIAHFECPRPRPDQLAEQRQWLSVVLQRIEALPPGLRDAMRLRVLEDRSTDDVCHALGISEENLFVRIHRARKQLLS